MREPSIEVLDGGKLFLLATEKSSLVLGVFDGRLLRYFWGASMRPSPGAAEAMRRDTAPFGVTEDPADPSWSTGRLHLEHPAPSAGDRRRPAFSARSASSASFAPRLRSFRVYEGRPSLRGLPCARATEADSRTLELTLEDGASGFELILSYTLFRGSDIIAHNARYRNGGTVPIDLSRVSSFSFDLPLRRELELVSLEGAWARERNLERRPIPPGLTILSSSSGCSSHRFSPACVLAGPSADENEGEVLGALLVYSGDWHLSFERDEYDALRCSGGLGGEGFSWRLEPGESLDCPEALLCRSGAGLSGLSDSYHRFCGERIVPPAWSGRPRPVLVNTWEAAYFDFDGRALDDIARRAAGLGAELFVLDDGWFGQRDDARSSLGDWIPNEGKLGGSLAELAGRVNALGLDFGLWIEPEMISPDSELFREHPDWALVAPGMPVSTGRDQLVADLTRPDVRREIASRIRSLLASAPIAYVKWDFNRPLGIAGSPYLPPERQGEAPHRFMLGAYALIEELTSAFPDILFEGCSGGGGRMDYGILRYMPQYWASDNTDATARLAIQRGASLFFPPSAIGAHVSASPNHQTGRASSMLARIAVAMGGLFGFELDLASLPAEELRLAAEATAWYKERRRLLQFGNFRRLEAGGPGGEDDSAWMTIGEDGRQAILIWARPRAIANPGSRFLVLVGLEPGIEYDLSVPAFATGGEAASLAPAFRGRRCTLRGDELMARGIEIVPGAGDGAALILEIRARGPADSGEERV